MKNYKILALVFLFALSFVESDAREYSVQHPLIVVGKFDSYPYEYIDENGKPQGFNVELISALLDKMDIPYEVRLMSWSQALYDIKTGKADIACAQYNKNRAERYNFGKSKITYIYKSIAYRKGSKPLRVLSDLKNEKIVLIKNNVSVDILNELGYNGNVIIADNISVALKWLSHDKCKYVMWNQMPLQHAIKKYGYTNISICEVDLPPDECRFISPDRILLAKVDRTFAYMRKYGKLDEIYHKWLHTQMGSVWSYIPYYIYYSFATLVIIIVTLQLFMFSLHRKERKASVKLKEKMRRISLAMREGNLFVWRYDIVKGRFYSVEGQDLPDEGITYEENARRLHPDDFKKFDNIIKQLVSGEIKEASDFFRIKGSIEGEWRYIEKILVSECSPEGKVTAVICTHKDVTEEHNDLIQLNDNAKKLKDAFDEINKYSMEMNYVLQTAKMKFWSLDIKNRTLAISQDINKVDYTESPETYISRIAEEQKDNVKRTIDRMYKGRLGTFSVECTYKKYEDMEPVHELVLGMPVKDDAGNVLSYFGVLRDDTELAKTRIEFENEKLVAQEADRLKSAFVANMSYDIRTPLNSIIGFSDLMLLSDNVEDRKKFSKIINTNISELLTLINRIIEQSKKEVKVVN